LNLGLPHTKAQNAVRGRRKKAAWDDAYMLQIIADHAHA
jgi:hypothetical protein